MYGNNQFMIDNLSRQRERLDDMIKNYQALPQAPINNIITNGQPQDNLYEMRKLNENDEVENIAVFRDTLFLGEDRLQLKKLDGTIEKYEIKKVYPRDKKDDKIDELNQRILELEMKLNEPTRTNDATNEPIQTSSEQGEDVELNDRTKSTTSKSVSRSKSTTTS